MAKSAPNWYKDTDLMDLLIRKEVPFAEGNIMKYVYRWKLKDGLKDLYKARDYLNALITAEEIQPVLKEPELKYQDDYPKMNDLFDGIK